LFWKITNFKRAGGFALLLYQERKKMTKIEWTEKTWNPVTGCTKISEGCQNCYACKMHKRLQAMGQEKYKDGFSKVVFHPEELSRKFGKKPKMIFVNSMSDTFHGNISTANINNILEAIKINSHHTFQILTKRSDRLLYYGFPKNAWVGL
jgi:protein gp37